MAAHEDTEQIMAEEPIDPDVDLSVRRQRWELRQGFWSIITVVALGGAIGAVARYAIGMAWPTPPAEFPWATLTINVAGCGLIGVMMVLITDVWSAPRLVRPFLGTGVLGGFTTFSTYTVDVQRLITSGAPRTALVYLLITPVSAMVAVGAAMILARLTVRSLR
ncbi:MAG TPA: fluoride efflux transporter CrcB [Pseudonocardiaceae bacterium]